MKVLIGTPTYDKTVHLTYMLTVMECMSTLVENKIENELMHVPGSLVDMARNKIAARIANDKEITHLLFIDDDIGFSPESFAKLIENSDLHILGLTCPLRQIPPKVNVVGLGDEVRPGIYECNTVGTGAMLIRREVFDKMIEAEVAPVYPDDGLAYQFFRTEVIGGAYRGEDVGFCLRWRELGGKVYCVTDCEVTHRGHHEFKYENELGKALAQVRAAKEKLGESTKAAIESLTPAEKKLLAERFKTSAGALEKIDEGHKKGTVPGRE